MEWALVLVNGLVAGTLTGIVSFGPSLMLLPPLVVLVGPEGGFTECEIGRIVDAGFAKMPLGPRTLRAETAAVAALATAQQLAGWLG